MMSGYDFLKSQVFSCWRKVIDWLRCRYLLRQSVPDTRSSNRERPVTDCWTNSPHKSEHVCLPVEHSLFHADVPLSATEVLLSQDRVCGTVYTLLYDRSPAMDSLGNIWRHIYSGPRNRSILWLLSAIRILLLTDLLHPEIYEHMHIFTYRWRDNPKI